MCARNLTHVKLKVKLGFFDPIGVMLKTARILYLALPSPCLVLLVLSIHSGIQAPISKVHNHVYRSTCLLHGHRFDALKEGNVKKDTLLCTIFGWVNKRKYRHLFSSPGGRSTSQSFTCAAV